MIFSTKLFTYNSKENTFVAFASDLNCNYATKISLQSHKTGKILNFYLDKTIYNKENELTHWIFKIDINEEINLRVIIFND